jgi:hypothetical protein
MKADELAAALEVRLPANVATAAFHIAPDLL